MPTRTYIQLAWMILAVVSGSLGYLTLCIAFGAGPDRCYADALCYASNAIAGMLFMAVFSISVVSAFPSRTKG